MLYLCNYKAYLIHLGVIIRLWVFFQMCKYQYMCCRSRQNKDDTVYKWKSLSFALNKKHLKHMKSTNDNIYTPNLYQIIAKYVFAFVISLQRRILIKWRTHFFSKWTNRYDFTIKIHKSLLVRRALSLQRIGRIAWLAQWNEERVRLEKDRRTCKLLRYYHQDKEKQFEVLPSGRRLWSIRTKTCPLRNSFFPSSDGLLNKKVHHSPRHIPRRFAQ